MPSKPPFSLTVTQLPCNTESGTTKRLSHNISKGELLLAIEDKETFYELYVAVTNRAIDMYAKGGRRKFALKLHGTLAALDVYAALYSIHTSVLLTIFESHRGCFSPALQTYTSLPAHYAPHMWTSLECFMLSRALDTHVELHKPKDREWIHILLSFLKAYVDDFGKELLVYEEDKKAYVSRLIGEMRSAVCGLEAGNNCSSSRAP